VLYTAGQKRLYRSFIPVEKNTFLLEYAEKCINTPRISGTALFFARHASHIPAYIPKTMFQNGIIYERNIIVVVKPANEPHGIHTQLSNLSDGLDLLLIYPGYMEMLDVESILRVEGIDERTIFYGQEEIVPSSPLWGIFAMMKNLSPSFVSFYKFPHQKLIGVARRAEI
jgi:KUP system potassium uptake protein